jgi:hypothetical protein
VRLGFEAALLDTLDEILVVPLLPVLEVEVE